MPVKQLRQLVEWLQLRMYQPDVDTERDRWRKDLMVMLSLIWIPAATLVTIIAVVEWVKGDFNFRSTAGAVSYLAVITFGFHRSLRRRTPTPFALCMALPLHLILLPVFFLHGCSFIDKGQPYPFLVIACASLVVQLLVPDPVWVRNASLAYVMVTANGMLLAENFFQDSESMHCMEEYRGVPRGVSFVVMCLAYTVLLGLAAYSAQALAGQAAARDLAALGRVVAQPAARAAAAQAGGRYAVHGQDLPMVVAALETVTQRISVWPRLFCHVPHVTEDVTVLEDCVRRIAELTEEGAMQGSARRVPHTFSSPLFRSATSLAEQSPTAPPRVCFPMCDDLSHPVTCLTQSCDGISEQPSLMHDGSCESERFGCEATKQLTPGVPRTQREFPYGPATLRLRAGFGRECDAVAAPKVSGTFDWFADAANDDFVSAGGSLYNMTCRTTAANLTTHERAIVESMISKSCFEDEVKENEAIPVDIDAGVGDQLTFMINGGLYFLPGVDNPDDYTPERLSSYEYQKSCLPLTAKAWDGVSDECTFRLTKRVLPVWSFTIQFRCSVLPPEDLPALRCVMGGLQVHHALLMERTRRKRGTTDFVKKCKSVLAFHFVPGCGALACNMTVIAITYVPRLIGAIMPRFGSIGAHDVAETATRTRRYLREVESGDDGEPHAV
eukprot:TRINITY_DN26824_c0_g1_i1.p1 TRINITY_DN26824_c0_g1~~TRINITY_DN26824_c0_g1_i1.p1  ORF type:complete len:692 (+),score=227.98 TRINITY_DN26824_c0_g1_i1:71-2077(+)